MEQIYSTLKSIMSHSGRHARSNIIQQANECALLSGRQPLVSISSDAMQLLNYDLTPKLRSLPIFPKVTMSDPLELMERIDTHTTRLNHWGIGYTCPDLRAEINFYKRLTRHTHYNVYEETSDISGTKWLFIGDTTDYTNSLFEVVLHQSDKTSLDDWYPHVQLDLDTDLNPISLQQAIRQTIDKDSLHWQLDIKNYGTVLYMNRLGRVENINFYLGLGTSLRDTLYHRKHQLIKL